MKTYTIFNKVLLTTDTVDAGVLPKKFGHFDLFDILKLCPQGSWENKHYIVKRIN